MFPKQFAQLQLPLPVHEPIDSPARHVPAKKKPTLLEWRVEVIVPDV